MFSLVIPVYKNEGSLPDLLSELRVLTSSLTGALEVVFVVDGSPDNCFVWLREHLKSQPFASKLCLHSRNFGAMAAVRTGLAQAAGPYFAVMAADLQEPISLAAESFSLLAADEADVAIAAREGREDPFPSSLFSSVFWWAYRKFVIADIPSGGVDVFGCNRACRDELLRLEELNSSIIGLLFWVGFRRRLVPYRRASRKHGKSAWTFTRKVRYLFDSVYSFSDLPIRLLKWIGIWVASIALCLGFAVFFVRGLLDVSRFLDTPPQC